MSPRALLAKARTKLRRRVAVFRLRREARGQRTETYWRRRQARQRRRLRLIAFRYSWRFHAAGARERVGIAFTTFGAVVKAIVVGGALAAMVLAGEQVIARYAFPSLVPEGDSALPLGPLLTIAIPVSASFLGFYLASVSIVLGTSYHDVSPAVRSLVLSNARTRVYLSEPAYPRWVETDYSTASLALNTSTPLPARLEPVTDWLERRSARLASVAVEACVPADDPDSALRVTQASVQTVRELARCSHLADALTFAEDIRDCCWSGEHDNATARLLAFEPPRLLSDLLLGWREAIASWAGEVQRAVAETDWDRASTSVVQIRGPARVWTAAQRLLREVHAEHEIEGRRVTPEWYLESTLATEYILALREFAAQFPRLVEDFLRPGLEHPSASIRAAAGCQALQAIAKAELVVDAIPQAMEALERLQKAHDKQPHAEFDGLAERIHACRAPVLQSLADALTELEPEQSKSAPDLFGETFFRLIHHTEQAIASGDTDLVNRVFPQILNAALRLQQHLASTYTPPSYRVVPAIIYGPITDLLELSGLALIYEVLRGDDGSADTVRAAWNVWNEGTVEPPAAASALLDILDAVTVDFLHESPRGLIRAEWERRLITRVVEDGYARPDYVPWGGHP